jgi:hypothetical protein
MVSPQEWGPNAWDLLHGIAERVGNHTNRYQILDEQNELRLTLRHFSALLPCIKCQKHYKEYIHKSFPNTKLYGVYLQDSLREWLYNLHNDVNNTRGIITELTLETVKEKYSAVDLRSAATRLRSVYQRGLQTNSIKVDEWKAAWKHLDFLLRFIGV